MTHYKVEEAGPTPPGRGAAARSAGLMIFRKAEILVTRLKLVPTFKVIEAIFFLSSRVKKRPDFIEEQAVVFGFWLVDFISLLLIAGVLTCLRRS